MANRNRIRWALFWLAAIIAVILALMPGTVDGADCRSPVIDAFIDKGDTSSDPFAEFLEGDFLPCKVPAQRRLFIAWGILAAGVVVLVFLRAESVSKSS